VDNEETALVWDITQRIVVIYYRRFGTTYRSLIQDSRIQFLNADDGTARLSRNVGDKLPLLTTQ
jgi:hypothetical protein